MKNNLKKINRKQKSQFRINYKVLLTLIKQNYKMIYKIKKINKI